MSSMLALTPNAAAPNTSSILEQRISPGRINNSIYISASVYRLLRLTMRSASDIPYVSKYSDRVDLACSQAL